MVEGALGEYALGDFEIPGGGGGGGGGGGYQQPYGTHRYWRYLPATDNSSFMYVPELIFREHPGGTALTGTPISGGGVWAGNVAANAFDGNTATGFEANDTHDGSAWLGLDFGGTATSVVEVQIDGTDGGNERPLHASIQYSDDGTTWTTAWTIGYWSRLVSTNLSTSPDWDWGTDTNQHLYWRARTVTNVAGAGTILYTLEFRETLSGSPNNTGLLIAGEEGAGFDGGNVGANAFDGNSGTYSGLYNNDGADLVWLGRHFPEPVQILEVYMVRGATGNERPTSIDIDYSDDGVTWTTAWNIAWGTGAGTTITSDDPDPETVGGGGDPTVLDVTVSEGIEFASANVVSKAISLSLAETLNVSSTTIGGVGHAYTISISEALNLTPTAVGGIGHLYTISVTEGLSLADAETDELHQRGQPVTVTETINFSSTFDIQRVWTILQNLLLAPAINTSAVFNISLDQHLMLSDAFRRSDALTVSEILNLTPTLTTLDAWAIRERLAIAQALKATAILSGDITEHLNLSQPDADVSKQFDPLTQSFTLHDTLSAAMRMGATLTETLDLADAALLRLTISLTVDETLELSHTELLNQILQGDITEQMDLHAVYISPDNQLATWVMNTRNSAVTEYTNYDFNSFAQIGHKFVGARSDGLYELDGADDNGTDIIWKLKSGFAQFNGSRRNGFKAVYLAIRGEGDYVMKLDTADGKHYGYKIRAHDGATTKIPVGKGLQARYWSFELTGIGARSELDSLEFVPLRMNRRV